MRKAEEVERLGLAEAPGRAILSGVAPELDQPGLVGMQLQAKLREPLTEIVEELLGITEVLEPAHKVVGEPHGDQIAPGIATSPLTDPAVEP